MKVIYTITVGSITVTIGQTTIHCSQSEQLITDSLEVMTRLESTEDELVLKPASLGYYFVTNDRLITFMVL